MKRSKYSRFLTILLLAFSSLSIFTTPLSIIIPIIQQAFEVAVQSLLSMALVASHYAHVKPHFPSKAEPSCVQVLINPSIQSFLKEVSAKTGIVMRPDFLKQLDAAGMHHDFSKIGLLLTHIEYAPGAQGSSVIKKIIEQKQSDINPYLLVPGIKVFDQTIQYPTASYSCQMADSPVAKNTLTAFTAAPVELTNQKLDAQTIFQPHGEHKQSNSDPSVPSNAQQSTNIPYQTPQVSVGEISHDASKTLAKKSMQNFLHQGSLAHAQSHNQAVNELQSAMQSLYPHLQDSSLRSQLSSYVQLYKKILNDACQIGASPEILKAQTKIATQGLPLPGFLQGFSDALQEKLASLCFDTNGNWRGIENGQDLENIQHASKAYNSMLARLSIHFDFENTSKAERCIEDLYVMNQGHDSLLMRFFTWVSSHFDDSISYQDLRELILKNPYNNQVFTALELLEEKEFKFARLPLEHLNATYKTSNGVLLHHQLLNQYRQDIQSLYGNCKIPLIYQNDPVYWLYKPTLSQMQDGDPNIALIQAHLAIRDSIYQELIYKINGNKPASPFMQHIAYGIVGKISDPIAVIDHLQQLSSDSQNPEIRQTCNLFFESGILKLFDLQKQAQGYGISLPDSINLQQNADLRAAANKLLLIDAQTEQGQRSLKLALQALPYACGNNEFASDYKNIILAITQAHTQTGSPTGVLTIKTIPVPVSSTDDFNAVILKAAGKAARNDLAPATTQQPTASPLTVVEAWEYIHEIQNLAEHGNLAQAKALAETYLQGYIDEQMPLKKHMYRALAAGATVTAAASSLWWATSGDQPKQLPKIVPQGPSQKSDPPNDDEENDEDTENEKSHSDSKLKEILSNSKRGKKTKGKSKIFEKKGSYDDALKDFEILKPSNVREMAAGKGKIGDLLNNRTVNVRNTSEDGRSTLEILNRINKRKIKIRYGF